MVLLSFVLCSFGQGNKQEADKKAIEQLIHDEVNAFLAFPDQQSLIQW